MIQLSYKQQIAFSSLSIIAGNALYALTVVLFLVPSGLITGGATGIALGVNRVLGLPVSGVLFAINISMLVLGWMVLGSRFALTTIASTILSPLFLALWERVFADFVLTDDLVLNTIFAGLGVGISLGITIRAGASTGGMDIPPLVIHKYTGLPLSALVMCVDGATVILGAVVYGIEASMIGLLSVFVSGQVIKRVLTLGAQASKTLFIVSEHWEEIRRAISDQIDRGVTLIPSLGGFSNEQKMMVMTVVKQNQYASLQKLIARIDPEAFFVVSDADEVQGAGFTFSQRHRSRTDVHVKNFR